MAKDDYEDDSSSSHDEEEQEDIALLNEDDEDPDGQAEPQEGDQGNGFSIHCSSCLSLGLYIAYFCGAATAITAVLVIDHDKKCDQPLFLWTFVQLTILIAGLVVRIWTSANQYKRINRGDEAEFSFCWRMQARAGEFLQKLLNMFWCVWFIIGMVWTFNTDTCHSTAPSLFVLSLTLISINLFLIGLCILCCLVVLICFGVVYFVNPEALGRQPNRGATKKDIDQLEVQTYREGLLEDIADAKCAICLSSYEAGDELRFLPCTPKKHHFHRTCVDEWLLLNKTCPFCKRSIDQTEPTAGAPADDILNDSQV